MIILAFLLIYSTDASNLEHTIQHRLFNRFIDDLDSDHNAANENIFDEIKYESNAKLRNLDDLLKARQRYELVDIQNHYIVIMIINK